MNFTAIDFETANRKRTSACSIGLAKVRDGKVVDTFYSLLRPVPEEFEFQNIAIHGITREMVWNAPTMLEIWGDVLRFVADDVLVAHSVSFEQSVINQYMAHYQRPVPGFEYLCTLYMSKVNYPKRLSYKLDDLMKDLFGKAVNHHHALEDALACAELAVHHIGQFREQSPRELVKVLYDTPVSQKTEWKKLTGTKPTKDELDETHPFFGKKIVITGNLSSMSRERAVQLLVDCGAVYQSSVTKGTNFLVVGDQEYQLEQYGKESAKYRQVKMFNELEGPKIRLLYEDDLIRLAKGERIVLDEE